jgi:predicted HicB family RNase H-like nuclease
MKAKRMGRPPLAEKERKATHLSVRFTRDEHREIERAAKAAGVALSEWARGVILSASSSGGADTS